LSMLYACVCFLEYVLALTNVSEHFGTGKSMP